MSSYIKSIVKDGHFKIFQLIIDNVDGKNPKNSYEKTPLDLAKSNEQQQVYHLFKK